MKATLLFTALLVVTVAIIGVLWAIPFSSPRERQAIEVSAAVAVGVQIFSFVIARSLLKQNFMTGWLIGVAMRFVALIVYAFVAVKTLGFPAPAALLSLATFLFISTVLEPKLLSL